MRSFLLAGMLFLGVLTSPGQAPNAILQTINHAATDSLKIVAYQSLINHYHYTSIDSARFFAHEALKFARENEDAYGAGIILHTIGQVNERHGHLDQARSQYWEALQIFTELGNKKAIAATTNGLGVVAGRTGKYDEATRYFLEALSLFEEIGSTDGVVQSYIKLGVVNDHLGNLDESLEYYLKAEKLNATQPSSGAYLTLMNNIGIIYGKKDDLGTALKYFRRGLRASDPVKNTAVHIALLGSLGIAYDRSGVPDSGWHFQQQALSMARENNLPEEEARALVNLAALVSNTDPSQSLLLLNQALVIAERIRQLKLITEVYEAMIEIYKETDQYKSALTLSEKRQILKDSLFSLEKSKEIANLHATHEIARQENEIRTLASKNEKSIFQRNMMIAVAMTAIVAIGLVWFYNTRISALNTQLIANQGELRNSNTLKDKLFSILGHDLRAPLNRVIGLLHVLTVKRHDEEETRIIEKLRLQSQNTLDILDNLLLWGQNQLKGIRLNPQAIGVKTQVNKTMRLSADYAAQKNVHLVDCIADGLHVQADPSHFDFVVRNLLSNAIKFSHSGGKVSINAVPFADDEVILSVHDSGVGIPVDLQNKIFTSGNESLHGTWNEKGTGIGLMLCREYITENSGRLWLESQPGQGSTFFFSLKRVHVPAEEPAHV